MPGKLFELLKNDVSCVTGSNLRNIMLLVNKDNIEDLNPTDIEEMVYCPVEEKDKWKIDVGKNSWNCSMAV